MKKLLATVMVLVLLLTGASAFAADQGVVVIGGDETEATPVSLDDIQIDQAAVMPGYAQLTPKSFEFSRKFPYYDKAYSSYGNYHESGNTAAYALLKVSILNEKMESFDFYTDITNITLIYNDKYRYGGWVYQFNVDYSYDIVIDESRIFKIDPMYEGYYLIGGALPNAVVNGKEPLSLTFNLGENEITYNIRK